MYSELNVFKELEKLDKKSKNKLALLIKKQKIIGSFLSVSETFQKNEQKNFQGLVLKNISEKILTKKNEIIEKMNYYYLAARIQYDLCKRECDLFNFNCKDDVSFNHYEFVTGFTQAIELSFDWEKCSLISFELAFYLYSIKDYSMASDFFLKAYEYAIKNNTFIILSIDALKMSNLSLFKIANYELIVNNLIKIMKIYENNFIPFPDYQSTYLGLFSIYILLNDFNNCLNVLDKQWFKGKNEEPSILYSLLKDLYNETKFEKYRNKEIILELVDNIIEKINHSNESIVYLNLLKKKYK